jgi:hypothetical protein
MCNLIFESIISKKTKTLEIPLFVNYPQPRIFETLENAPEYPMKTVAKMEVFKKYLNSLPKINLDDLLGNLEEGDRIYEICARADFFLNHEQNWIKCKMNRKKRNEIGMFYGYSFPRFATISDMSLISTLPSGTK